MTGRQTLSTFRRFACATAVAFFAVLAWSPRSSDAAWDGTHTIHLGDTISAEFVNPPLAEEHKYSFYAMANTTMNTTVTVDSEAVGLVPEVTLYAGDETQIDLGATQVGNKIKNFKFTVSGPYYLRVRATAGTGTYKLATKGKFASPINGSTTTGTFAFDAGADVLLDAVVKKSQGS